MRVPTVFTILAPLANPARPRHQCLGVADARIAPIAANVLAARGADALIVCGDDGLGELTTTTTSQVWIVHKGHVRHAVLDPGEPGTPRAHLTDLRGGDTRLNAQVVTNVLGGVKGPVRDIVLLNAAAALIAADIDDTPLPEQLTARRDICAEAIGSGKAAAALAAWVEATQSAQAP